MVDQSTHFLDFLHTSIFAAVSSLRASSLTPIPTASSTQETFYDGPAFRPFELRVHQPPVPVPFDVIPLRTTTQKSCSPVCPSPMAHADSRHTLPQ